MEVRKEAFNARKSRATSTEESEDEEDADELSSISEGTLPALFEEWESWYPQEWVGWIMYGVPSENPRDHWVHQPTSEGPTSEAQREQSFNASKPSQANNISTPLVAATTLSVKPTPSNLNAYHHESDEIENFGESFLALDSFESELT